MRTITVSVQVLPMTADPYPVVDAAIAAIQATGIKHMVTPMETVLEGSWEACMEAARVAHEACFMSGVQKAVTIIKVADDVSSSSTIDDKLAKYRA